MHMNTKKFFEKKILGMPIICFFGVLFVLAIGILIGSFLDFDISWGLKNVTTLGSNFATYGSIVSFCLYPAAGMCLFKALKKKGKEYNFLAWVLLSISFFLAVYYSDSYNGSKFRDLFGSFPDGIPFYVFLLSYLFWIVIYSWVPLLFYFILDDTNPSELIAIGVTILVAGVISDCLNLWLKQVGSRPRFKYLLTLEDPRSEFKNWWQWNPYFAESKDSFKSWPSGNMAIASMMFSFPLLMRSVKKSNKILVYVSFALSCVYVVLYGYNRIHMTNHFLSDVCFGTLFGYLVYVIVDQAFEFKRKKTSVEIGKNKN